MSSVISCFSSSEESKGGLVGRASGISLWVSLASSLSVGMLEKIRALWCLCVHNIKGALRDVHKRFKNDSQASVSEDPDFFKRTEKNLGLIFCCCDSPALSNNASAERTIRAFYARPFRCSPD